MKAAIKMEIIVLGSETPVVSRAYDKKPREGRWIRFKSSHVEGTARFISRDRDPGAGMIGTRLTVEICYDRVEQCQLLVEFMAKVGQSPVICQKKRVVFIRSWHGEA